MSAPFLSIARIAKSYAGTKAVDDVSLDIAEGEFVTFLGPSGSGKSTTLYIIAGFVEPSAGEVLLGGRSLLAVPPHQRGIGMVFQRYTLFPHLSVAENIAFPLRVRRRPRAEIADKVDEMLRLVRLEGMRGRRPGQLSGGQQQRVALARALAYDPRILLMDEPLSALDKKLREEIQGEIRRVHVETGVTVLYVTHDQEEALRLSDRIALFNHGRIEQVGDGRDLYERPASAFVAGFIGNSNFLPVRVVAAAGRHAVVSCPDGFELRGVRVAARPAGAEPTLMLRPERLWLAPGGAGEGIAGTVVDAAFLGDCIAYRVRTGWAQDLAVRTPLAALGGAPAGVGQEVRVCCEGRHAFLFAAL